MSGKITAMHNNYLSNVQAQISAIKQEIIAKKIAEEFAPYKVNVEKSTGDLIVALENEAAAKKRKIDEELAAEKIAVQKNATIAIASKEQECRRNAEILVDAVCGDYLKALEKCAETIKDI